MTGSVGPTPGYKNVPHITAIGYIMIAALALLFLPLLPFLAVFWLVGKRVDPDSPGAEAA